MKGMTAEDAAVLILVLVEHTLGVLMLSSIILAIVVLILVLVEHTLGDGIVSADGVRAIRLNPCFSGTYSRSQEQKRIGRAFGKS